MRGRARRAAIQPRGHVHTRGGRDGHGITGGHRRTHGHRDRFPVSHARPHRARIAHSDGHPKGHAIPEPDRDPIPIADTLSNLPALRQRWHFARSVLRQRSGW